MFQKKISRDKHIFYVQ